MKYLFSLLCVGFTINLLAQKADKDFLFSIICFKNQHSLNSDKKFILSVENLRSEPLTILYPENIVPYHHATDKAMVWFEIVFLSDTDSITVTENARAHIYEKDESVDSLKLHYHKEFLFNAFISNLYFQKAGKYKIRFILNKNISKNFKSDIYTKWIYIDVTQN